jgi:hypothetical protein
MHREALAVRLETEMDLPNFRIVLVNVLGGVGDTTALAEILDGEPFQTAGGYASQPFAYTGGTSTYDPVIGYQRTPNVTVEFTEAVGEAGYAHSHVCLWQGRGAVSNKQIVSLDTSTDIINVNAHGLVNGDRAFVRSSGALPGGALIQRYYTKVLSLDTLELYTDAGLTTKVNFTSQGSGTLYLQYANGNLFDYASNPGQVNAGQTKSFIVSYQVQ